MTPDDWRQIEDLYHAARADGADPRAVLAGCCDPSIRSRVERMLAKDSVEFILDKPAPDLADDECEMAVFEGAQFGPYRIEGQIGAGGMGAVYRALDTRLGRPVALKVLDERYAERLYSEARAISSLNHPHICTLFDVGENYLVMELLEGESLKDRIARGPFSSGEFLSVAIAIAEGLNAAHSIGIVHRDIKPGNLFLTTRGIVKILDFGLARTVGPAEFCQTPSSTESIFGTPSYMSPEQGSGAAVDARTDLFSFGVVLHEMATGSAQPTPGHELDGRLPPELSRIVRRALERAPDRRYQSAAEMLADLVAVQRPAGSPPLLYPAIAGIGLILLLAIATSRWWFPSRQAVTNPAEYIQLTSFTDSATAPALSPDGRLLAFVRGSKAFLGSGQIYIKPLPDGPSMQLSNDGQLKFGPVFSPDGSHVAYSRVDRASFSWDTLTVPVTGGPPALLLRNASGLTWIDGNHVLFSKVATGVHMGIVTAGQDGSGARDIYFPSHERGMAHFSYLSPNHRHLLIVEMDGDGVFRQCRLAPFDGSSAGRKVGPAGTCTSAAWSPDGKWMYLGVAAGGNAHLWRQKFPNGTPEQITFGASEETGIAVAPDGRSLVTSVGVDESAVWMHDARGNRIICSEGYAVIPRFSRDGRSVYYLRKRNSAAAAGELYKVDVASGSTRRVLAGLTMSYYDLSRDDRKILYTNTIASVSEVWVAGLDSPSNPHRVAAAADRPAFGPDGAVYYRSLGKNENYLYKVKDDGSERQRVLSLPITDLYGVSPDGKSVLISKPGSGQMPPVIAQPIDGSAPRQICSHYCYAVWSYDGHYLYISKTTTSIGGDTAAIPVPQGQALPNPAGMARGGLHIPQPIISPGPDPSIYLFTEQRIERNLFRIPLH